MKVAELRIQIQILNARVDTLERLFSEFIERKKDFESTLVLHDDRKIGEIAGLGQEWRGDEEGALSDGERTNLFMEPSQIKAAEEKFANSTKARSLLLTLLLAVGLAGEAAKADTFTRTGLRMTVERSYKGSGSRTVSRELQNGATVVRSTSCASNPWLAGCSSSANIWAQSGQEYPIERNTLANWYRGGSISSIAGPVRNTLLPPRRWSR